MHPHPTLPMTSHESWGQLTSMACFLICKMGLNRLPQRVAGMAAKSSAQGRTRQGEDFSKCQVFIYHHL